MARKRLWLFLGLIGLLLLAGCGGTTDTPTETSETETLTTNTKTAETPSTTVSDATSTMTSSTSESAASPTTTTADLPDNPFREERVSIAVRSDAYANESRFKSAGKEAISYWAENTDRAGYPIEINYTDHSSRADVVITYRPTIETCGDQIATGGTFYYCGPLLEQDDRVDSVQKVDVAGRYRYAETVEITKEVLGQLFGRENPQDIPGIEPVESPPLRDPFIGDGPVIVGVTNSVNDRDFNPLVQEALEYWEAAPDSQKNYSVDFVLERNASSPDVEVRFTESVATCGAEGNVTDLLGCAPVLNEDQEAEPPERIEIVTGYTDQTTVETIKHEFGHLLGRQHGQDPMPLMSEVTANSTQLPQPDATARENPWRTTSLLVYADYGSIHADEEEAKEQVHGALQYYRDHPEYRPRNLSLEVTTNRSKADIRINGSTDHCESLDEGSCHLIYGHDIDPDDALEYYTSEYIFVNVDREENIGWHVGTWLGYSLHGANETGELPPPFDEPETDDRDDFWK